MTDGLGKEQSETTFVGMAEREIEVCIEVQSQILDCWLCRRALGRAKLFHVGFTHL